MKKLNLINSTMLPLKMSNVDTDQIMPKQFLKRCLLYTSDAADE